MAQKQTLQLFNDRQIRTAWDDKDEKWYFSIVDVVAVLMDSIDYQTARKYWKVLKGRLLQEGDELVTTCYQLKLKAADGKMRLTDVADQTQLFRLIQSIPSPKAELSQKRNPSNFEQNKKVAKGGGHVAKIAREELEKQLGRSVVTSANAKGLKDPDDEVHRQLGNDTKK